MCIPNLNQTDLDCRFCSINSLGVRPFVGLHCVSNVHREVYRLCPPDSRSSSVQQSLRLDDDPVFTDKVRPLMYIIAGILPLMYIIGTRH